MSETQNRQTCFERIYALLLWCILGAFLLYGLGLLNHAGRLLSYPFSVDYVEWPEIARAWDLVQGRTLYPTWDQLPLRESNYTPIFTLINALGVSVTGPTPFFGRLIALVSTLGIMLVVSALIYPHTQKKRSIALISGTLYASAHMVWLWSGIVRVDNLAVFLSLLGLLVYSRRHAHSRFRILSIVLCVLSAFVRQTMVAAAAAILLHSIIENRTQGLRSLGLYLVLGCMGFGGLVFFSDGQAWTHLITANMNVLDWSILPHYLSELWTLYHWLLPSILLGIWVLRHQVVLLSYAVFATLVSLTIVKVGSSLNYLLEWWAAMCVFGGAGLVFPFMVYGWKRVLSGLILVLSFLAGWQNIIHMPWEKVYVDGLGLRSMPIGTWMSLVESNLWLPFYRFNPMGREPMVALAQNLKRYSNLPAQLELDNFRELEDGLAQVEGPIFSEDMNFTLSIGKEISVQPFEFAQLAHQDLWSPEPLHNCFKSRCFGAVVLMFDVDSEEIPYASQLRFTPQSLSLIAQEYELSARVGPYRVYLPTSVSRDH